MKAVLLSVKPKWCKLIFSGEKTIEVRKTAPKLETPFKVYVYCTKERMTRVPSMYAYLHKNEPGACAGYGTIETWGEIGDVIVNPHLASKHVPFGMHGKVIGEFVCDEIYVRPANVIYYGKGQEDYLDLLKSACMTEREVLDYMGGQFNRDTYFWHVTNLKIYDKPRELGDFSKYGYKYLGGCCVNNNCKNYVYNGYYQPPECKIDGCFLKRPPQSWMYVEELQ